MCFNICNNLIYTFSLVSKKLSLVNRYRYLSQMFRKSFAQQSLFLLCHLFLTVHVKFLTIRFSNMFHKLITGNISLSINFNYIFHKLIAHKHLFKHLFYGYAQYFKEIFNILCNNVVQCISENLTSIAIIFSLFETKEFLRRLFANTCDLLLQTSFWWFHYFRIKYLYKIQLLFAHIYYYIYNIPILY